MQLDLPALTEEAVSRILGLGVAQGHAADGWQSDSTDMHLWKAISHLAQAERQRKGWSPVDAEGPRGHLERALARVAMALWQVRRDETTEV